MDILAVEDPLSFTHPLLLAIELEAWYLTSAVLVPDRAPDAHRRTEAITARSRSASTPA